MQLVQFAEPVPGQEPADVLRTAVFMANFAAQDVTGRADASRGVAELFDALAHPAPDARTYIFAATEEAVSGPISELGYPLVPTSGDAPEPEVLGWLVATAPLTDNTSVLELSLVLDVDLQPMDGQLPEESGAVVQFLLEHAAKVAQSLGRSVLQLWQQHCLDMPSVYGEIFEGAGFAPALTMTEFVLPVEDSDIPADVLTVSNEDFPAGIATDVTEIYAAASVDQPWGSLHVEQENWDAARLAESTAHFRALGTENYHAFIVDDEKVAAMSEVWIHAGTDPEVGVQGLTYVQPEYRGKDYSLTVARAALAAAQQAHPELSRVYTSAAEGHTEQLAMIEALTGEAVSRVSAWQRTC